MFQKKLKEVLSGNEFKPDWIKGSSSVTVFEQIFIKGNHAKEYGDSEEKEAENYVTAEESHANKVKIRIAEPGIRHSKMKNSCLALLGESRTSTPPKCCSEELKRFEFVAIKDFTSKLSGNHLGFTNEFEYGSGNKVVFDVNSINEFDSMEIPDERDSDVAFPYTSHTTPKST